MGLTAERTLLLASLGRATNAGLIEAARLVDRRIPAVELRLDALGETPDLPALRAAFRGRTLLATLRSRDEGGRFEGTEAEAAALLGAALDAGFDLVDVEFARAGEGLLGLPGERVVVSAHDVAGLPDDLEERSARMAATGARYVKVVATARGLDDALRLLRLQASREKGRLAAFGMGEAGLVTRVLSPYLGAALSFGAALPGEATAPGQLLAADLLDVYAVGRSRRVEALFALLGSRVSHSFSPAIHNAAFEALGLPALYVPVALGSLGGELPRLREALAGFGLPLRGASVTIPFKEEAAALAGARDGRRREHAPLRRGRRRVGREHRPGRAPRRDPRGAGIGRRPRPRGGRHGPRRRRGARGARLGRRRGGADARRAPRPSPPPAARAPWRIRRPPGSRTESS